MFLFGAFTTSLLVGLISTFVLDKSFLFWVLFVAWSVIMVSCGALIEQSERGE